MPKCEICGKDANHLTDMGWCDFCYEIRRGDWETRGLI